MFKKLSITILHEINNHLNFIPGITQIIEIQIQYLKCFIKHSYTFISFSKFLLQLFKWIRDCQKKRKSRLSSKHLKKIPIKKFKKGENPKLLDVFTFHRLYWEINQCTGFSWSIKRTWTFFFLCKNWKLGLQSELNSKNTKSTNIETVLPCYLESLVFLIPANCVTNFDSLSAIVIVYYY